jgi:lipid-binding SYLF domain-containing protein
MRHIKNLFVLSLVLLSYLICVSPVSAATAKEIDAGVEATLDRFHKEVTDSQKIMKGAKGVLVFPSVIKAGFGVGGEFGEGALLIGGKTVDYYNTAAASIGLQIGAQKKSIIILFTETGALEKFRNASGWKAGVDASIAVVNVGGAGSMDTSKANQPIIAYVLGQKGLMYNISLEGAKFTKVKK